MYYSNSSCTAGIAMGDVSDTGSQARWVSKTKRMQEKFSDLIYKHL